MKYEKSCGAVIFKEDKVLLIKSVKGHWSFPKGHVEGNETELETAHREIFEETNLKVILNENIRIVINYSPYPGVTKDVVYFYATYVSGDCQRQVAEVERVDWFDISDAMNLITFESEKNVLKEIIKCDCL